MGQRLGDLGACETALEPTTQIELELLVVAHRGQCDDGDQAAISERQVRFYSDAQTQQEPAKRNTGLFFLRGRPGAPFAIIAPGGGFSYVASVHEGFPYAAAISTKGYNAFVLRYRAGQGGTVATRDLAAAISYIFSNAASLRVGTAGYSLWGSSAGARMAASIGSHGVANYGGENSPKPSTVVMAYTGHSDYASVEPPTFVVVGEDDGIGCPFAVVQLRPLQDTDARQLLLLARGAQFHRFR